MPRESTTACTRRSRAARSSWPSASRPDGFGITETARRYMSPLIAGESYPTYRDGLPDYAALRNESVPKRLPPFTA